MFSLEYLYWSEIAKIPSNRDFFVLDGASFFLELYEFLVDLFALLFEKEKNPTLYIHKIHRDIKLGQK